ncbi:unknown [Bacteroides sp. CAG:875]|nr:unknown [Bacteroides sp. CAG:875]
MCHSPGMTHHAGYSCRKETGQNGLVAHPAHHNDLQTENGSGQRRTKHGGKTGADTDSYHQPVVSAPHAKQAGKLVGYCPTHLYTGAFSTGRTTEQMGQYGTNVHQGSHPERYDVMRRTDFLYQIIVPPGSGPSQVMVHQSND